MAEAVGTVASIWRFPVKSMQGEEIAATDVTPAGIPGDRAYALLDEATGKVVSAKRPRFWERMLCFRAGFVDEPEADQDPPPAWIELDSGERVSTDEGGAAALLSKVFGRDVRIITSAPAGSQIEEWWPAEKGDVSYGSPADDAQDRSDDEVLIQYPVSGAAPAGTLFDLSALHTITTGTLRALASAYPEGDFDVRRFRANLVVETEGADFRENEWGRRVLQIGAVRAKAIIATPRCAMTTLAQPGLPKDLRILKTMAEHNRFGAGGLGALPCAGLYAAVLSGGRLALGDDFAVEDASVRS